MRRCQLTLWAYDTETCGCDFRLGLVRLTIDDHIRLFNYEEFDVLGAFIEFERIYRDIPDNYLLIQMNH